METALHTISRNKKKETVPSVTTVINDLGWNKEALTRWTRNMVEQGQDPDKVRDHAAAVGTLAHALIDGYFTGVPVDTSLYTPAAQEEAASCFLAFRNWESGHRIEVLGSEVPVISEEHQYGGTVDLIASIDGIRSILDWKTGRGVYPEHEIQLAAYGQAWNETHPDEPVAAFHLIHLDREAATYRHHCYDDLASSFTIFRHLRAIYDLRPQG